MLPEGASRVDLRNVRPLIDYMAQCADLWFGHINDPNGFGRCIDNLCLVTGCDKASSWGVASFSNKYKEKEISIKFVATDFGIGDSYAWSTNNSVLARASKVGVDATGKPLPQNQCLFIRGYHLSRRSRRFGKGWRVSVSDRSYRSSVWKV